VYTSPDIRFAYWAQRYVPFGYAIAMRIMNRQAQRVLVRR
jgi:hypothetical protein